MEYYFFHNKRLPEENPKKKLYRKRIKDWKNILYHTFYNCDIGFFTVEKIWNYAEYCEHRTREIASLQKTIETHWFTYNTMQIRTEAGEKLIVRKLPYDLDGTFNTSVDEMRRIK